MNEDAYALVKDNRVGEALQVNQITLGELFLLILDLTVIFTHYANIFLQNGKSPGTNAVVQSSMKIEINDVFFL